MEGALDVFGVEQVLGHHLGVGHGHQHRFIDQLRACRAQRITNDGPPVLPNEVQRFAPTHGLDQRGQVLHQGGLVIKARAGHAARWVAAQVWRHRAIAGLGQGVHLVRPGGGGVGETMQHQHLGSTALAQASKGLSVGTDVLGLHTDTASLCPLRCE